MAGNGWPLQNELSTAVNEILMVELQSLKGSCATNQRRLRLIIKNTKKLSGHGSSL
jgi:ribosomal protein S18